MAPREFWGSTVMDVSHAFRGFIAYEGGKEETPLDAEEVDELMAWMDEYG